jgi:hypothetical protein
MAAGVLDRDAGAPTQLLREGELVLAERPAGLRRAKRDRPTMRSAPGIATTATERVPISRSISRWRSSRACAAMSASSNEGQQQRVAITQHRGRSGVVRHRREARAQLAQELPPARVEMGDSGRAGSAPLVGEVDDRPVGDVRHQRPGGLSSVAATSSEDAISLLASASRR